SSTTTYIDSGLTPGETYYYRITGVDSGISDTYMLEGNYSIEASAQPQSPVEVKIIVDIGNASNNVLIRGDFNSWSWTDELSQEADGRWSCTELVQPNVSYEYKIVMNDNHEENVEYELSYYDTSSADSIYVIGLKEDWNRPGSNRMRKLTGTDTWVIYFTSLKADDDYKFYINGADEPGDNRTIVNSSNGDNRKLMVTGVDTIYIDWSGHGNPPGSLSALGSGDTSIKLTIGTQSSSDDGMDSYYWKIYRSPASDSGYVLRDTIPSSTTTYIDSGLTPGETYYYRITGVDSGISDTYMLEGNYSIEASAQP
ncbi:MAG: hypothetical protein GY841_16690, partial [FCB group bacterium]|nr:hypothetical protein [FCB group bacterium]